MQSIGRYFCPIVVCGFWVHMACWHFTWQLRGRLGIGEALAVSEQSCYTYLRCDMADKRFQRANLKQSCNTERIIEHIGQNVAWELSWELWVEGNVKWIWKVSSERWREATGSLCNITGVLKANIDVSIYVLTHYLHKSRPVNYIGKSSL